METDLSEAANADVNNCQRVYSSLNQEVMKFVNNEDCSEFQTPNDCKSGDSGFHSITPDSAGSLQNLSLMHQHFSSLGMITPEVSTRATGTFYPYTMPLHSTPENCMEMMETSLYPDDEEMKDNFISNETDHFNLNDVHENNVLIFKDEKSTNIFSLCYDLRTNKIFSTSERFEEANKPTLVSNMEVLQKKTGDMQETHALFNTASSLEHSLILNSPNDKPNDENELLESSKSNPNIEMDLNFNQQNIKEIVQTINNLPPLTSPIKPNFTPSTGSILKKRRCLIGIEKLDILYLLGVKENFLNVVSTIFSFLTPKDLMTVKNVSVTWNQIFSNTTPNQKRWKDFRKENRMEKENRSSSLSEHLKQLRKRGRETYLSTIENTSSLLRPPRFSPQTSPVVSPSKRRFHLFHKEGQKLKQGERLLRCPKCSFPSRDPGTTYATCTRIGCRYEFCIFCSGEFTSSHNCPPLYTPRPCKRSGIIGSKNSKRNLRRL